MYVFAVVQQRRHKNEIFNEFTFRGSNEAASVDRQLIQPRGSVVLLKKNSQCNLHTKETKTGEWKVQARRGAFVAPNLHSKNILELPSSVPYFGIIKISGVSVPPCPRNNLRLSTNTANVFKQKRRGQRETRIYPATGNRKIKNSIVTSR